MLAAHGRQRLTEEDVATTMLAVTPSGPQDASIEIEKVRSGPARALRVERARQGQPIRAYEHTRERDHIRAQPGSGRVA